MNWRWASIVAITIVGAAAAATFLEHPLAIGAVLALLAASVLMRTRLPQPTPIADFRPRTLMEGVWMAVWFWEGFGPAVALAMRGALYYYSILSLLLSLSLAVVACIGYLTHRGEYLRGLTVVPRLLLLTLVVALISIFDAPVQPADGLLETMARVLTIGSVSLSVTLCYKAVASASRALALAVQAFVVGVAGTTVALVAFGGLQVQRFGVEDVVHPNTVGGLCGISLVLLLGYWQRVGKWWMVPVLGLVMFALFLSFSKTALLAVAVALMIWSVLAAPRERMWRTAVLSIAVIAVLLLAGDQFIDYLASYFESPSGAVTLSGRTELWESTVRLWLERPVIGYGYGLYPDVIAALAPEIVWNVERIAHAHNSMLTVLLEMGILGGALLVGWIAAIVAGLVRRLGRFQRAPEVIAWTMLFAFILVRSATEGGLAFRGDVPMLLLISLGIARWRVATTARVGQGQSPASSESTAADLPERRVLDSRPAWSKRHSRVT